MGFGVWGLGFRVWGLGFRAWGLRVPQWMLQGIQGGTPMRDLRGNLRVLLGGYFGSGLQL